jgi:DNA processing protein
MTFDFSPDIAISPVAEISAYETLWTRYRTHKQIGVLFSEHNHAMPGKVVEAVGIGRDLVEQVQEKVEDLLPFDRYTALFRNDADYPVALTELRNGPEVIYYQGSLDLLFSKCVAVVGARKASPEGVKRARKLTKLLVENGFTVMSGLAAGIDTAAHSAALEVGGRTIGVIGTPLSDVYPRSNADLQRQIASEQLLISQVPFYQTSQQDFRQNRFFFPERNRTMAALSVATVIVEASDTSGSLVQAREALKLNRKLFILQSCFERGLTWPATFERKGALRVVEGTEIIDQLRAVPSPNAQ